MAKAKATAKERARTTRLALTTVKGASIEVRELTTADRIELLGDEDDLKQFILNQDGTDAYRPALDRTAERATRIADKDLPSSAPRKNRALDYLHALAEYFLVCTDPQGFPWGDTLADVWFKAPEGRFDGMPNFWVYDVQNERSRRQLSEAEVKN